MSRVGNWISEFTFTQGTGSVSLSGKSGSSFTEFKRALTAGDVWYSIKDGANREAGIGAFDGNNILARTTVHVTMVNGVMVTNSPSPINLSGNAIISCTFNTTAFTTMYEHSTASGNPHATNFIELADVDDFDYVGKAGYQPSVKLDESGLELTPAGSSLNSVRWRGRWSRGTYDAGDMIRGDSWTMVANKQTTDLPYPTKVGVSAYIGDNSAWDKSSIADVVFTGLRLTPTNTDINVSGVRIWLEDVNVSTTYTVSLINNISGNVRSLGLVVGNSLDSPNWYNLPTQQFLVKAGEDVSIFVAVEMLSASNSFSTTWAFDDSDNTAIIPSAGEARMLDNHRALHISYTDAGDVDREALVKTAATGSQLVLTDGADSTRSYTYNVLDNQDEGTYAKIYLGLLEASDQPVRVASSIFSFTTPVYNTVNYVNKPDYFANTTLASGQLRIGSGTPVDNNDGYGVDVNIVKIKTSPDWDIVAATSAVTDVGSTVLSSGVADGWTGLEDCN